MEERNCKSCHHRFEEGDDVYFYHGVYYCSQQCLHQDVSEETWENEYDDNEDDVYYTTYTSL